MVHSSHRPKLFIASLAWLASSLLVAGSVVQAAPSARHSHAAVPVIEITRQGGNIRPFSVAIGADGAITVSGIQPRSPVTIPKAAVRGLLTLARAEHFFALSPHIVGQRVNPDVASISITVQTPTRSWTVTERGARNAHFDQFFAVVMAAAQLSF